MMRVFAARVIPVALALASGYAGTLHVDATHGDDARDGRSPVQAVRTIQRAADLAQAGDEVVIGPGVYFERVQLSPRTRGEPNRPIVFRADRIQRGRVILTGAHRAIREGGKDIWNLVDADLGLYATPFRGKGPSRVTYDNVDLFPYGSLDELRSFTTSWEGGSPGPRHGFFHDAEAGFLYVRLHPGGKYGAPDPGSHVMAVSPPTSSGRAFSIPGRGPAYLVIEGITFETPGDSGIYTEASVVTVRDCWFFGCPYAVRGNHQGAAKTGEAGQWETASEITIEHCEITELSTFQDATEILEATAPNQHAPWSAIWHRKTTGRYGLPPRIKNYENGIAVRMGRGWVIRHNFIHDIFEGLANDGMSNAEDVEISDNVFARICDNAIETENHARNVRIMRNLFLDVFEPFSWQPHGGPPWPGPIVFCQNVIANTPENAAIWGRSIHNRGVFKIGISLKNWKGGRNADVPKDDLTAPTPGLLFVNNTIWFPRGRLITLMGSREVPVKNVLFARNLIATDFVLAPEPEDELRPGIFAFRQNLVAPASPGKPGPGQLVAGTEAEGGRAFSDAASLGWINPKEGNFQLQPENPAKVSGEPVVGIPELPFLGALQPGETWFPPAVGPRETP